MKRLILTVILIMFAQVTIGQTNFDIIKTFSKSASLAEMAKQIRQNLRLDKVAEITSRKSQLATYSFLNNTGDAVVVVLIEYTSEGEPSSINYLLSNELEERFRNSIKEHELFWSKDSQLVKDNWFSKQGNYYYQYKNQDGGTIVFKIYP